MENLFYKVREINLKERVLEVFIYVRLQKWKSFLEFEDICTSM